eukprot:CAMPEP_0115843170 /NCGR_PEP_ID=MMETSP0287-20121206/8176_1 /TAXON_ID=412157 /ORGANISM="Chrysochromulina rotalis, Strain UIO044" /LENGTH=84 /DNA_ID=CAMNT_0003296859 /DNA_START=811 /DNA_END=1066 /DNA_ORIENTATION=-
MSKLQHTRRAVLEECCVSSSADLDIAPEDDEHLRAGLALMENSLALRVVLKIEEGRYLADCEGWESGEEVDVRQDAFRERCFEA